MQNIQLCVLQDYPGLLAALEAIFCTSKSKVKKFMGTQYLKNPVTKGQELSLHIDLVNDLHIHYDYQGPTIDCLYEDELFLVLNKPPHIDSHPLVYSDRDNCLSYLRQHYPREYLLVNYQKYDRGLLHRLDRETSGVLIYIKDAEILNEFRENYRQKVILKNYLAIVQGNFQKEGRHKHIVRKAMEKGKKVLCVPEDCRNGSEQTVELEVFKLSYSSHFDLTLLQVQLITGFRHQIRTQLSYLGYPLLGDVLYGGKAAARIYLHALEYKLIFKNKIYSFHAPLDHLFDPYIKFWTPKTDSYNWE